MKNALLAALFLPAACATTAQQAPARQPSTRQAPARQPSSQQPSAIVLAHIAAATPPDEAVAPLIYLASDQLKGRYIGRPEIDTAALYIADQFREAGAQPVPGATGYFQFFTHRFNANPRDSSSAAQDIRLRNVLAFIPGLDPQLHQQYIVLSSHYDHLGVTRRPQMEEGKLDSIYNGARDNASGTTAVIDAARYFGKHPARRSVMFICFTAEEEGLIGSEWYAAHPLVPFNRTVYQLNIDNASYDDTALATLVGLHRTT